MATANSYRGQVNLHLFFASKHLEAAMHDDGEAWGGHYARAMVEAAVWQLQLAYQSHLADLVVQQPRFALPVPADRYTAQSFKAGELPPEISELAQREREPGWLRELLEFAFLQQPGSIDTSSMLSGVITSDAAFSEFGAATSMETLALWQRELQSLVTRHRSSLQEY